MWGLSEHCFLGRRKSGGRRVKLQVIQVLKQFGQLCFEQLAEHRHVYGKSMHRIGEVALGQDVIYQVDHAHERVFFSFVHDFEYQRGYYVKSLTVADSFVVASERKQNSFEQGAVLVVVLAAEGAAAGSVQIFHYLYAEFVVVGIGAVVECDAPHFVPV